MDVVLIQWVFNTVSVNNFDMELFTVKCICVVSLPQGKLIQKSSSKYWLYAYQFLMVNKTHLGIVSVQYKHTNVKRAFTKDQQKYLLKQSTITCIYCSHTKQQYQQLSHVQKRKWPRVKISEQIDVFPITKSGFEGGRRLLLTCCWMTCLEAWGWCEVPHPEEPIYRCLERQTNQLRLSQMHLS